MREVFEWVSSLDLAVIYTAVIGFATTWGGSIIALVVAVIKQRAKNFNYQQALDKLQIQLTEQQTAQIETLRTDILLTLDNISKGLVAKEDENAKARMDAIKGLQADVDTAVNELETAFNPYETAKELK